MKAWDGTRPVRSNCFGTHLQLPFVFGLAEGLSDHEVEAVTVCESVPDGVRQDFSGVFVYEDKLAPKSAVSPNGRELLKDSRFKLV